MNNKLKAFFHGILPAFLIPLSIGSVYAFSKISDSLTASVGCANSLTLIAFMLSIFFLGMGAAFFGKYVEKNIKFSAFLGMTLFTLGTCLTGLGAHIHNIWLVYLGYGFFNGIAQGILYITPVKCLMMWISKRKGLAGAIPIVAFGLGQSLCVILFKTFSPLYSLPKVFLIFAGIYFMMMLIGALLIKKPISEEKLNEGKVNDFKYSILLKDKFFWRAWTFMFLNIGCGLALIPKMEQILNEANLVPFMISIVLILAGVFNGAGRLVFAMITDYLKKRMNILYAILIISVLITIPAIFYYPFIGVALLIINACYGAGFSTCPSILADHYGMQNISKIHGAVLSAWGIASIFGYVLDLIVISIFGNYFPLLFMISIIYLFTIADVMSMSKIDR